MGFSRFFGIVLHRIHSKKDSGRGQTATGYCYPQPSAVYSRCVQDENWRAASQAKITFLSTNGSSGSTAYQIITVSAWFIAVEMLRSDFRSFWLSPTYMVKKYHKIGRKNINPN